MSGTQTLRSSLSSARPRGGRILNAGRIGARRCLFFGLVGITTLAATAMMLDIFRMAGLTPLELAILPLFALTFAWISVAFWNAVIGFALQLTRRDPLSPVAATSGDTADNTITTRTAVVMPIHNEEPARVIQPLLA